MFLQTIQVGKAYLISNLKVYFFCFEQNDLFYIYKNDKILGLTYQI